MSFTIDELAIPATIDAEGGTDFARGVEIENALKAIAFGTADLDYEPVEALPWYNDAFEPERMFFARVDGVIVGRASYGTRASEDSDSGWLSVDVLPEFWGRGIGRALADTVEGLVIADGKPKALVYTPTEDVPGERLASPTGFGSIPAETRGAQFLLTRGYRLEQVERVSRLPLPVPDLGALLAAAVGKSGPDYALHYWVGRTPERWNEDLALLGTRMSTDAPSAGLEEQEDVWTVERVIASDDLVLATPRTRITVAVEYVPSGHLVGFSALSAPRQLTRSVAQYATIVMREHRGRRLGMLMKVANLAHLERVAPGHPSVVTYNAEENRHMLVVNEAVGFVPIGFEGAWRKDLLP